MIDALPNLHAVVLHFPIVLLPLAVACEVIGLFRPRVLSLEHLSSATWAMAAAATVTAFAAGRQAADGLVDVPPNAQLALSDHADAAWLLLLGVLPVAGVRLGAHPFGTRVGVGTRALATVVGVALLFQLVITADRGGALVYRHALAVRTSEQPACPTVQPAPASPRAASRWRSESDGTAVWEPRPGDLGPGRVVRVVGTAHELNGERFTVGADGPALILVPGTWDDVQVNATVDLAGFEGTLGIVHHLADANTYSAFTVTTKGVARLIQVSESGVAELHQASWERSSNSVLSVSSAGSHVKGLVGGRTVNHGHAAAPRAGEVGLLIEGAGTVAIDKVEVIPLRPE